MKDDGAERLDASCDTTKYSVKYLKCTKIQLTQSCHGVKVMC